MIETSPDTDISFFEALAQVVRKSGLKPAQIARRANDQVKEMIDAIPDPAERLLADMATVRLHRATVGRAIKGESSISEKTLSLIAVGLGLDEETRRWLEELRKAEPYVHHSTQTQAIVRGDEQASQLPGWLFDTNRHE